MNVFTPLNALSVVISRLTESVGYYDQNFVIMGHFMTKMNFWGHSTIVTAFRASSWRCRIFSFNI
jgi:hypothetical protein